MKIYLSTWTEVSQGETLNKVEVENRLLSFFFLKDCTDEWLAEYFENGVGKGRLHKAGVSAERKRRKKEKCQTA